MESALRLQGALGFKNALTNLKNLFNFRLSLKLGPY
jgi:hypothetical protein